MGVRVAHAMTGRTIDYLELDDGFALVETTAPRELIGRSLAEPGAMPVPRERGVRQAGRRIVHYATPDTVLREGDLLVVAGETAAADAFAALP